MLRASLRSVADPLREHVCFSCLAQSLRSRSHGLRPFHSKAESLASARTKHLPKTPFAPKKKRLPKHVSPRDSEDGTPSASGSRKTRRKSDKPPRKPADSPVRRVVWMDPRKDEKSKLIQTIVTKAPPQVPQSTETSETRGAVLNGDETKETGSINSIDFPLKPLDVETPPVPGLSFGLERVLFNPGVYHLRDPRSRVYNFDPYLGSIMPVTEFDFAALKDYITSSKDDTLRNITKKEKKKYMGSSSSMTSALSHFHYLLSAWREINIRTLSKGFPDRLQTFTRLLRAPSAMFLRYQDGVYAIDADKEFDSANILMNLGKSMEKLLTLPKEDFERYRRTHENKISPEEEQAVPESYHYSTLGDFVMRSQLDAYDPRLPGTGMFDLKTRAVVSIRMDAQNFEHGLGYEIRDRYGGFESYEREFYDMIRAAFLKYSLQVRIGRMDGIFVAFHNIQRIFGFQYVSLPEMDSALHGQENTCLGDQEFRLSISLWNKVLDQVTDRFPERSVRLHYETRDSVSGPFMYIFAEPVTDEEIHAIQNKNKEEIDAYQRRILDLAPHDDPEESTSTPDADQEASSPSDTTTATDPNQTEEQPKDPKPNSPYKYDSEAPPDESFLADEPPVDDGDENKELLGLSLVIRNKVNGQYVDRPTKLTENDEWVVEYGIGEMSAARALSKLQGCKARREKALAGRGEDETGFSNNGYMHKLREFAQKGRAFREQEDLKDKEEGLIVLNEKV